MKLFKNTALPLLSTLLLAAVAHAQVVTDTETRSKSYPYGGGQFGGSATISGSITQKYLQGQRATSSNFTGYLNLEKRVTIFGNDVQAAEIGVTGENERYLLPATQPWIASVVSGYQPTTSAYLRVGGQTIWSPTATSALSLDQNWSASWSADTPALSLTVHPLGIPITMSAWAGCAANVGLGVIANWSTLSLYGDAGASAYGAASVAIGWSWASAGVSATLTFGAPSVDLGVGAQALAGITGSITVNMAYVKLWLKLFAKVQIGWIKKKWEKTIYTWSAGGQPVWTVSF